MVGIDRIPPEVTSRTTLRPAEYLRCPRHGESRIDPLLDDGSLELANDPAHPGHGLAGRRGAPAMFETAN